jgi:surface antigen
VSATVQQFLDVARRELGTIERPTNRTKYGEWCGYDGQAWCDQFVSWVADRAGCGDVVGKFAYTPSHAAFFRGRGQLNMTPAPGALVFFQWPGVGRICHVGIVEAVRSDGRIVTIEGNAQPGEGGDQSNGGGVYRRVRALSYVKGFGHPQFASESANAAEVKHSPAPPGVTGIAVDGSWGEQTTARLQQVLGGVSVDGKLGPLTIARLQVVLGGLKTDGDLGPRSIARLQQRVGAPVDGKLGPVTISALQARLNTGHL